jgi:hypothetical protein
MLAVQVRKKEDPPLWDMALRLPRPEPVPA